MTRVQPEELSALLDGELNPTRTREVEMQIAADPQLRGELQRLRESDARWRAAAATAAFQPAFRFGHASNRPGRFVAAATLLVTLTAVRIAAKLTDSLVLSFGVQAVVLVVLLAAIIWLARTSEGEARSLVPGASARS
jgi:anti-sigma factor RsiW